MTFTPCQEAAIKQFQGFLVSNHKYMVLSGGPGCGKTFLVSHLLEQLPNYRDTAKLLGTPILTDTVVSATTNKAAEVLQERIPTHGVFTVQSSLGLTVKDNYKTGKSELVKNKNFIHWVNTLLVVDEASMVNKELFDYIDEAMSTNCKVLFVGDSYQLPPVGEDYSVVFNSGFYSAELTTPVRFANPHLMQLNQTLRDSITNGALSKIDEVPGFIDFVTEAELSVMVDDHFVNQESENHKIITYTNNMTQMFNRYIRRKKGLPETIVEGDVVVSNSATENKGNGTSLRVEKEYVVRHIGDLVTNDIVPYYPVYLNAGLVRVAQDPDVLAKAIKDAAKDTNWTRYFALKNNHADLRFRYACTGHKSQGSTYHTVYIDLSDMETCFDKKTLLRLLYVAVSRATTRVVFVTR